MSPACTAALSRSTKADKSLEFANLAGSYPFEPVVELFPCARAHQPPRIAEPARRPASPPCAETGAAPAFLVRRPPGPSVCEETGRQLVVRAQEAVEADRVFGRSSALGEGNEPLACTPSCRSGERQERPVPDATEQYYDSPLSIAQRGRTGADQSPPFVGAAARSGNVSLLNQRETVAWPMPTCESLGGSREKPCLRKATTCSY